MHAQVPARFVLVLLLALLGFAGSAASAKEIGRFAAPDQSFELYVDSFPAATDDPGLVLNKMTSLDVRVVPREPATAVAVSALAIDARMPQHDHGMVVLPKITALVPNEYQVDGVKLHMAGEWELLFEVKVGGETVKITAPVKVTP